MCSMPANIYTSICAVCVYVGPMFARIIFNARALLSLLLLLVSFVYARHNHIDVCKHLTQSLK